jgi:hypothetical protein
MTGDTGDTGDSVECFNCGRANPSWAQVCRSCGVPLRSAAARTQPTGPLPTDRDSLISIGAGVGSILLAVILGVLLSGIIPEAEPVAEDTPSPEPSRTPIASSSAAGSGPLSSLGPSAEATPALIGSVTFGLGINELSREVIDQTDTFGPGTRFCHSVAMTEAFGVNRIQEEILRVADDGTVTVVQERQAANLTVNPAALIAGFCANSSALISAWGPGTYLLRDYRNEETPELIAEGRFTLTN